MHVPKNDYKRIYLDLDRTLYETSRAAGLIRAALAKAYADHGITTELLTNEQEQFHQTVGEWYTYDFFAHMAAHDLNEQAVRELLIRELEPENLLYPDALELLDALEPRRDDVVILTFGNRQYQEFKRALVPRIKDYTFVSILSSKGDYISAQSQRPSIIFDDKQILDLPEDCQGVLLDRTRETSFEQVDGYWIINDLSVAKEML